MTTVNIDPRDLEPFRVSSVSDVPPAGATLTQSDRASLAADAIRLAACPDCDGESIRGDHIAGSLLESSGWEHLLHV